MQDSTTSQLIPCIDDVIAYLCQVFTPKPGDVIFTAMPPGAGRACKAPGWLQPCDIIEVAISGVGSPRNTVNRLGARMRA